jgi:hypothetical protein
MSQQRIKIDDVKDRFYEELECAFNELTKQNTKIVLQDFNAKVVMEDSNQQLGMRDYTKFITI